MLFILIPGLIIVALMVFASTRIKKVAATAFEAETIETDDFVIQKPEGFLNIINGDPHYLFETYSKEFGIDATEMRQGRVNLTVREGVAIDDAAAVIKAANDETVDDINEVIGSRTYRVIETKRVENDFDVSVIYKLADQGGKVYIVEAIRLAETSGEFARRVEAFIGSFELK